MALTSESMANFATRFCNKLDKEENFICSPLSVETLLALLTLGSSKDTRAELVTALDIPNEHALRTTFSSVTRSLDFQLNRTDERNIALHMANKIYVKKGGVLKSDVRKDAVTVFRSDFEPIDFNESLAAANTINNWVANQTNNTIQEIVSSTMFDKDTALVLVNAIYFQGFWEIPFKAEDIYRYEKFHINNTYHIRIDMMLMEGPSFNYKRCPELKAQILQMFYEGGEASMVIVLPDEIEGLKTVMEKLSSGYDLMANIKSLEKTSLKLVIPKFKIETKIDLKQLLPKMGIKTIFDVSKSDINILSSNERLYVSEAVQKAYIAVDEKGTEVAAVALPILRQLSSDHFWNGEEFLAIHPFLYIVIAREIPIFYGIFYGIENIEEIKMIPTHKVKKPKSFWERFLLRRKTSNAKTTRQNKT